MLEAAPEKPHTGLRTVAEPYQVLVLHVPNLEAYLHVCTCVRFILLLLVGCIIASR